MTTAWTAASDVSSDSYTAAQAARWDDPASFWDGGGGAMQYYDATSVASTAWTAASASSASWVPLS